MTHEPDRPRRDVSIEEAQRMPMGEGELEGVPESVRRWVPEANDDREENPWAEKYLAAVPLLIAKHDALVAEVRRLRATLEHAETVWWIPAPPPEQLEAPSTEWPEGWTEVGATDQTGDTS